MIKIYSLLVFFSLILSVGAKKNPNFLFIIVDDQSPLDLRIYNSRSTLDTPNIERLAKEEWFLIVPFIWVRGWVEFVRLLAIW